MRTRSRTITEGSDSATMGYQSNTRHYWNNTPPSTTNGGINLGTASWYDYKVVERISDIDTGDHKKTNYVEHKVLRIEPRSDIASPWSHINTGTWPYSYTTYNPGSQFWQHYCREKLDTLAGSWLQSVNAYPDCWEVGEPSVSDQLAVSRLKDQATSPVAEGLQNFCEYRQSLDCFRQIEHGAGMMGNVFSPEAWRNAQTTAKRIRKAKKHGRLPKYIGKTATRIAKTSLKRASNYYLMYQFGIAPLLSDLNSAYRYLPLLEGSLKKFREQVPQRVTSSYEVPLTFSGLKSREDSLAGYGANNIHYTSQVQEGIVRYGMYFVEPLPRNYSKQQSRLDFLMRRLGTNGPASLAWELVPYSFVVDWFVDTGVMLRTLDNMLSFGPKVKVLDSWKSIKLRSTHTGYFMPVREDGGVVLEQGLGTVNYSYYVRQPVSTSATVPFQLQPRYKAKQVMLTAALACSRLKG